MDDYGIDTKPYLLIVGDDCMPIYLAFSDDEQRNPIWTTNLSDAHHFEVDAKLTNYLKHCLMQDKVVKVVKVSTVLETTDREYLLQKAHDDHMSYLIGQTA